MRNKSSFSFFTLVERSSLIRNDLKFALQEMHFIIAILAVIACIAHAEQRALVLLDDLNIENTHSAFFTYLQSSL
jgi:hypothetical protein